uniref:SelT/SelW/SelH family protein n=1 Tax=Eiseniibacteriota bacterium TaxID=2212470 RepID=A0A832MM11_UNCEI
MPRATGLAAEIKRARDVEVVLHKGHGGVFEVVYEGELIFSKKATGRFPETQEVLDRIPAG